MVTTWTFSFHLIKQWSLADVRHLVCWWKNPLVRHIFHWSKIWTSSCVIVGLILGMGIENRFLFRTGSQWTDSLESLAKFFNDSVIDSLCVCACANLLIQTAANMLAFWITSDWGEWDWWWNNSSWEALLSFLSNTTVLVFRSSVSLGASG